LRVAYGYSEQVMYQLEFSSKQAKRNDPQNSLKTLAMITRRNVIINLWFIFVVLYSFWRLFFSLLNEE